MVSIREICIHHIENFMTKISKFVAYRFIVNIFPSLWYFWLSCCCTRGSFFMVHLRGFVFMIGIFSPFTMLVVLHAYLSLWYTCAGWLFLNDICVSIFTVRAFGFILILLYTWLSSLKVCFSLSCTRGFLFAKHVLRLVDAAPSSWFSLYVIYDSLMLRVKIA